MPANGRWDLTRRLKVKYEHIVVKFMCEISGVITVYYIKKKLIGV